MLFRSIRMDPADRRAEILDAALRAATAVGFMRMTRDDIARAANTSPGLVSARLGTMRKLRDAVMQHAIKREALQVIAEGVALRHPHALKAPADLQARAVRSLVR